VAVNALGNHAGTVVVMDPKTGRVYTVVNQEWGLRRGFKPCSTVKLVTGLAGLSEKIIETPDVTAVADNRNRMDLTQALAVSNNPFFQQVGGRVGFDKMMLYARELGLGERTGINVPNEYAGRLPALKSGYAVNHMSSHGDDFEVTAVQLATLVSSMANGGKLLAPHIPRSKQEEAKFKPIVRREVNIDPNAFERMVPGMVGSVNYGSGKRAYDPTQTVAGKTGTCIQSGDWIGLFTSYAPLVNPRLAVVVIARRSDAHGHFPAAVAGQIYRDLNHRFGTPTDLPIATANVADTDEDKEAAAAREAQALIDGTEVPATTPGTEATPGSTPSPTPVETAPGNKTRKVLQQLPTKPTDKNKPPVGNKTQTPTVNTPPIEERQRRVNGDRP
jgi:cell division protein FtsI/penicillin-binding protein 2